jgi:hypothetical protein
MSPRTGTPNVWRLPLYAGRGYERANRKSAPKPDRRRALGYNSSWVRWRVDFGDWGSK